MIFLRIFFSILLFAAASMGSAALAQANRSILVLDASGSMWGQIAGEAKITIARRVIGEMLETLPAETELGLSAYGHREKGNCQDIELLVPPGPDTREAIRAAVAGINPKGKTPLSAAVIAAAEGLRFEEDAATVILVSDGRETCDLDPCAVGRTLEQSGVDFTAHVIGFDVSDPADRAQLSCLAEETGGEFLTASNASELSAALEQVAEPAAPPPPPEPERVDVEIVATDRPDGPIIPNGLRWTLQPQGDGGTSLADFEIGQLRMAMVPGVYQVTVTRPAKGDGATGQITVAPDGNNRFVLAIGSALPQATLAAPDEAPLGSQVLVDWTGPGESGDYITVVAPDEPEGRYGNYTYTTEGTPLSLRMPPDEGVFEIRYVLSEGSKTLASRTIAVTPVEVTLSAPAEAPIAGDVAVAWVGPNYQGDYITIVPEGTPDGQYQNYSYTSEGTPTVLKMPGTPGPHEIRYMLSQGPKVMASIPISVTDVLASIDAPASAPAGAQVLLNWEGPDAQGDFLTVAKPGDVPGKYETYRYTRDGSPVAMVMPGVPGEYELRYILNEDKKQLVTRPITITPPEVTLSAPERGAVGSVIAVEWTGPDSPNDYIAIAKPDAVVGRYENYGYTNRGNPASITLPGEPGTYELRYVLNTHKNILGKRTIVVEDVVGALSAPDAAPAGSRIMVEWQGPDNKNDYIAIGKPGTDGNRYEAYAYTNKGSPAGINLPGTPGNYELRYVLAQDKRILISRPIEVTAAGASFTLPESAEAGSVLTLPWEGPDNANDYISIAQPGADSRKYFSYARTNRGSPAQLKIPPDPGTYEVRYVLAQDHQVIETVMLEVTAASADISAPTTIGAGSPVVIAWEGPDNPTDYIALAKPDADPRKYETFARTNKGNPLRVTAPGIPGTYELRYILGSGHRIIAREVLEVVPVSADLQAPESAAAGSDVVVVWEGPDNPTDYISIAKPEADPRRYEKFVRTNRGNPARLKMPDAPGEYELRYTLGSDHVVITRVPIRVE